MTQERTFERQAFGMLGMGFTAFMDGMDNLQSQLEKFIDLSSAHASSLQEQCFSMIKGWLSTSRTMRDSYRKMVEPFLRA